MVTSSKLHGRTSNNYLVLNSNRLPPSNFTPASLSANQLKQRRSVLQSAKVTTTALGKTSFTKAQALGNQIREASHSKPFQNPTTGLGPVI